MWCGVMWCDVWQVLCPSAVWDRGAGTCWWMWELMDLQWFPVGWRWTRTTSTGHLTGVETSTCQCRLSETWYETAGNYCSRLGYQELTMSQNKTNSNWTSRYFPISSLWRIGEEYEEKIGIHRYLPIYSRTRGLKNQRASHWPSWRASTASTTTTWG